MQTIYSDADFLAVYKQRKKAWRTFWIVTALYAVYSVAWLVFYTTLPYGSPTAWVPQFCVYFATAVYFLFVFPFMGIRYSRINHYYKMLYYVTAGIKNDESGFFLGFDKKDLQKDGVDVYACVFTTWSKKRRDWMNREAYMDVEKPYPDLVRGDLVRYVVRGNFILEYDVLEHGALDKELEKDEDED